ncbi:MAG: T9SS type A sorting domain-containing protein [Bacteroidia bacterium]|nr:T9SS type A sorting domain-containing protein [Bacteroidia bacterium]
MKKIILSLTLWSVFVSALTAQQTFIRAYGNYPFNPPSSFLIPNDFEELPTGEILIFAFPGYFIKTDTLGKPLWVKKVFRQGASPNDSYPREVAFNGINEYFLTGQTSADTSFVAKTDSAGNLLWVKSFSEEDIYPHCLTTTSDGGVVVAFDFQKPNLNYDPLVIKLSNNGTVEWQKKYENILGGSSAMKFYEVAAADNGDLFFCGINNTGSSFYGPLVVKTNSAGEVLWSKLVGTAVQGNAARKIAILDNGNIRLMINRPETATLFGYLDLDPQGNALSGNAYTTSFSISDCVFNIHPSGEMLITTGNSDQGMGLTANGNVKFAYSYLQIIAPAFYNQIEPLFNADGSCTFLGAYSYTFFGDWTGILLKTTANGETSAGYFSPITVNKVPFPGASSSVTTTVTETSVNQEIALNLVIDNVTEFYDSLFTTFTAIDPEKKLNFSVYPNPANEKTIVTSEIFAKENTEISLFDLSGKIVFNDTFFSTEYMLSLSTLPSGTYLLRVVSGEKTGIQKLVIRH